MTMRGLTCAYLLRRIADLNAGRHRAAARGRRRGRAALHPVGPRCSASTSSAPSPPTRRPRSPGPTAAPHTIVYTREDVAARVRELTDGAGVPVAYDSIGAHHRPVVAGLAGAAAACWSASARRPGPIPPIDAMQLAVKGSLFVTRPALADYIADPAERAALAGELFGHVARRPHHGRDQPALRPRGRRPGAPRPRVRPQRRLLGLRPSSPDAYPLPAPTPTEQGETMTTVVDHTELDERFPSFTVGTRADRGRPAHRHHRRRAAPRQPGRGLARRRASSPSSGRCCCSTRCCSSATRTSPAPSTSPSPSGSARWRTTRSPAATPTTRAWCASTRTSTARPSTTRTPSTATPPGGEVPPMGSVLRCVEGPPVGGDTIWVNMAEAYRRLPEHVKAQIDGLRARHSIEASFGAAMPEEQRLALHERFPDAEHPVVRTHPETGEKVLFVNAFTTHFTNYHTPENVRFGFDYSPGAQRTAELPDPAGVRSRVPGALALDERTASPSGTTAAPSTTPSRTTGPPSARWSARESSAPPLSDPFLDPSDQNGEIPCTSSTTPCSPRTRRSWSSPRPPTGRSGSPPTSPRTSR